MGEISKLLAVPLPLKKDGQPRQKVPRLLTATLRCMDPWGMEDGALLARVELLLDGATYASLLDTESLKQILQGLLVRAQLSHSAGADAQRHCLARVLFCIGLHCKVLVAEEQAAPEPGVEHLDALAVLLEEMNTPAVPRPQCRFWCDIRGLKGLAYF